MTTSDSLRALRRANPRAEPGFAESVEAAARAVRAQVASLPVDNALDARRARRPRRRLVHVSVAGASFAAVAVTALFLTIGSPRGGPGVEGATAAVKRAATVTAASAERSGTAAVRITHGGQVWAEKTVRWNGADVAISDEAPGRPGRPDKGLLVVDGILYGPDGVGGWLALGSPASIDADSGTTPAEYLAAVREDVGGVTLRRITGGMTGLTRTQLADGSTVYSGTVAAGLIARESGFKEGQAIRVLPFGYVAHDEAADPAAPLEVAVTVGADVVVREIAVSWGTGASSWVYTVTYRSLGSTPAPAAPENARSLLEMRGLKDHIPAVPRRPGSSGSE
jgi:hypothetical protein